MLKTGATELVYPDPTKIVINKWVEKEKKPRPKSDYLKSLLITHIPLVEGIDFRLIKFSIMNYVEDT